MNEAGAAVAASVAKRARPADPCSFVIFGASGDLTKRLLVPALYNLAADGLLPEAFCVLGVARTPKTHEGFRADLETSRAEEFHPRALPEPYVNLSITAVG